MLSPDNATRPFAAYQYAISLVQRAINDGKRTNLNTEHIVADRTALDDAYAVYSEARAHFCMYDNSDYMVTLIGSWSHLDRIVSITRKKYGKSYA